MKSAQSTLFFSSILAVLLLTQIPTLLPTQSALPNTPALTASDTSESQSILAATIQIIVVPADQPEANDQMVYERGLGSLIQVGREVFILSHDHWMPLEEIAQVQFQNGDGKLLAEVSGAEFRELVRYQDQGTMLLTVPPELHPAYLSLLAARSGEKEYQPILPGSLADPRDLQVGQTVTLAYRVGKNRSQVGAKQAVIIAVSELDGLAAIRLQSLDGSVILPGDSGGGIWLDGRLVGNMWKSELAPKRGILTLVSSQPWEKFLDTSIAAALPDAVQTSFSQTEVADEMDESCAKCGEIR